MVNLFRILHAEWLSPLVHEYSCLLYSQEHSWCNFAFMNIPGTRLECFMNILEFIP